MKRRFKIRGWLIILIGITLTYLIQPILVQSSFTLSNSTSRANLAYVGVILGIGGDVLITLGIIISIAKLIRRQFSKENRNLSKK